MGSAKNNNSDTNLLANSYDNVIKNLSELLRISFGMIDEDGNFISMPATNSFSNQLLIKFILDNKVDIITKNNTEPFKDEFNLKYYSYAILNPQDNIKKFIIFGPIMLNKRISYEEIQNSCDMRSMEIPKDELNDIKVLTNNYIETIFKTITSIIEWGESQNARAMNLNNRATLILETLLSLALKLTDAQSGSVMFYDSREQVFTITIAKGLKEGLKRNKIESSSSLAGYVYKTGTPHFIENMNPNEEIQKYLTRSEIEKSIIIPFSIKNREYSGTMNLNLKSSSNLTIANLEGLNKIIEPVTRELYAFI